MLSQEERKKLVELLIGPVERAAGAGILINALPRPLRAAFTPSGTISVMVLDAISICEADGYNANPSAISQFLSDMALHSLDSSEILIQFADRLAVRPQPSGTPYEDLVLRRDLPYLDRQPLRKALRRTIAEQYYPILLVNGPSGSGKSFTARLIDHLVKCHSDLEHCIVWAPEKTEPPGALAIAKDMMTILGARASNLPPNTTNDKRWPRELANEVAVELKCRTEQDKRTWITVLDVSAGKPISDEVTAFIHQLAVSLITGVSRERHRLILMNFPEEALPGLEAEMQMVLLDGLSSAEISDELQRMFTQLGRAADAADLANGILNGLNEPHNDMREIGRRSTAIVRQLVA